MEKIKAVQIVRPEELRIIEMDMPRIDEKNIGSEKTSLGGKLSFSVDLSDGRKAGVRIYKN